MEPQNKLLVPMAIIIAGSLIAGALFFANRDKSTVAPVEDSSPNDSVSFFVPISSNDHILGNPNADVAIIEYSDLECPACKAFHTTAHKIIDDYGAGGKVAWAYRHFPLTQLHSKATEEAVAAECAATLGGNSVFWDYIDRIFEITPSNNGLDLALLRTTAGELGLNGEEFEDCLDDAELIEKVENSYEEAIRSGGTGTPFIIFAPRGGVDVDTIGIINSIRNQLNLRPDTLSVADDASHVRMVGALDVAVVDLIVSSLLQDITTTPQSDAENSDAEADAEIEE